MVRQVDEICFTERLPMNHFGIHFIVKSVQYGKWYECGSKRSGNRSTRCRRLGKIRGIHLKRRLRIIQSFYVGSRFTSFLESTGLKKISVCDECNFALAYLFWIYETTLSHVKMIKTDYRATLSGGRLEQSLRLAVSNILFARLRSIGQRNGTL